MVGTLNARLFLVTVLLFALISARGQYPSQQGAVLLSASTQTSPASIELQWPSYAGATSYRIWKRTPGNSSWGSSIADLGGAATSYTDNAVSAGSSYEYKVRRIGNGTGYGYVRTGIQVAASEMHARGKIILLVESGLATSLSNEINQLEDDLIGDGWYPIKIDVDASNTPQAVRALVIAQFNTDPSNVKAVYILGHVPVAYTGNIRPDGHNEHKGAWACDGYYGEMNGTWTDNSVNTTQSTTVWNHNTPGDGKFDQNDFPSSVELMVGRVHLGDLGAYGQSETQLLSDYLNKAHNFKIKNWETPATAVMYDKLSWVTDPLASSGYSSMAALVGANNLNDVNVYGVPWNDHRSVPHLINYHSDSGTQGYENGTVIYTGMNISTIDSLVAHPMGSVFHMTFGSYFGDWDNPNNYLRGLLASGNSLGSVWSGQPNWFMHPMAMGEPIGECAKLAMNNTNNNYSLQNGGWWSQGYARTHMGLMGDPTIRMKMVAPATQLVATNNSWYIDLSWTASAETVLGYYVYRINDATSEIELISPLITGTSFTSNSILFNPGDRYMVRAAAMTTTASGSFENLSLGAIAVASGTLLPDCEGVLGGASIEGMPCDDNDPLTANDTWDENCNCIGQTADCEGVIGGSAIPGSPCDDGDANTGNDSYDANCNCIGLPLDCEGNPGGSAVPGSPCDDSDANTGNDTYQSDCSCAGQLIDCLGVIGGTTLPGSACDDNDVSTGNDTYQSDCSCAGQLIDCQGVAGGNNLPGVACDDNDASTGNDLWDANCNCAGLPIDCEGLPGGTAVPGTTCNDGNSGTGNDIWDANCNCTGQLIDCIGVIGGNTLPGTACDDGDESTGNDAYDPNCNCVGQLIDCLGVAGGLDLPGSTCDDNDPTTGNDFYQSDCSCQGALIDCLGVPGGSALPGAACDDNDPSTGDDIYDSNCNCFGQPIDCEGVIGGSAIPGTACDDNDAGTGNDVYQADCSCAGQLIDCEGTIGGPILPGTPCDDGDPNTGNDQYQIDCSCGGALIDCEGVAGGNALPNTPCDDGDPNTGNDQYSSDCTCVGLFIDCEGVAGGAALPGNACDDGDPGTGNDTWDANCNCAGQLIDCEGVMGGSTLPGTACNDGDSTTGNDAYDANCNCVGQLIDCNGVAGGTALPGSSCDDGDATTGNDLYDVNCNCAGQLIDCEGTAGGTALHGTVCDDNDATTGNDLWDTNCNCVGLLIDCEGIAGGTALPGSSCDDNDASTGNDNWDSNCNCVGQLIDCEGVIGGSALSGSPCDDGDPNTNSDNYDSNCNCIGFVVDCEGTTGGSVLPGSPCDDGDPNTLQDSYDSNCNCSGILFDADSDGVADHIDLDDDNDGLFDTEEGTSSTQVLTVDQLLTPDGATTVFNVDLSAYSVPIGSQVAISDFLASGDLNGWFEYFNVDVNNGEQEFNFLYTGTSCAGLDPLNNNINANVNVDDIGGGVPGLELSCYVASAVDPVGSCSGVDLQFKITINTTSTSDTDTDGTPDSQDTDSDNDGCNDVLEAGFTDNDLDGYLDGTGINADGTVSGSADGYTGTNNSVTDNADLACPLDCNGVLNGPTMPGTACDDNNPDTGNDVYQSDCSCVGAPIDCLGVIDGNDLPGSPCDDGDPSTGNDQYQNDCSCLGQLIDCEGIPGGVNLPGVSCNDNDPNTGNDIYDASCNCVGTIIDCEGVIGGASLPGTICDDNDASTVNDTYQSDCSCVGLLIDCLGILGGTALPGTTCDDGDNGTIGDVYDSSCNCAGIPCDPTDPTQDCDSDGDGVANSIDLDDDNDGLYDNEEIEFVNVQFTYSNVIPPDGQSTNINIDLSSYNVPIGSTVNLSNFFAEGNLNGNSEFFELDFNNGELVFSNMDTDERCPGMEPVLGSPTGSVIAIDLGNGVSGVQLTATSSPGVNVINSCSVINIEFDISVTAISLTDTDNDGTPDQFDLDSDNDGCSDVLEAGFSDGDNDGLLGNSPITADQDGLVTSGTDGYAGTQASVTDSSIANCTITNYLNVALKLFLEGPFDESQGLMHDSLRSQGLIPLNEPYSQLGHILDANAALSMPASILNTTGNDAIVDWVLVELRPISDPTTTSGTVTGLLQRDGDVVNPTDPDLPVAFDLPLELYHIVVRHRNHLACMTFNAVDLSNEPTIDLTSFNTVTWGTDARLNKNGKMLMWAGNVVDDDAIKYTGTDNDRDPILIAVGGGVPTSTTAVYSQEDVNMDGLVKYTGSANDRDPILINIGGGIPTAIKQEQLP